MRFTITDEAIKRLELRPDLSGQEFEGPSIREGLFGGFIRKDKEWLKKQLGVRELALVDVFDSRLAYYLMAIKEEDHTILPFTRLGELALTDFMLAKHVVTSYDQDGDCGECSQPVDASIHIEPESPVEVPPTTAPAGPEPTPTA
jgi:hypothetical protein